MRLGIIAHGRLRVLATLAYIAYIAFVETGTWLVFDIAGGTLQTADRFLLAQETLAKLRIHACGTNTFHLLSSSPRTPR